jgi:hypothetical protein
VKGKVADVKEGSMNALFVNAFKEQQAQIERQQKEIIRLEQDIAVLKLLICKTNADAEVCKVRR